MKQPHADTPPRLDVGQFVSDLEAMLAMMSFGLAAMGGERQSDAHSKRDIKLSSTSATAPHLEDDVAEAVRRLAAPAGARR